VGSNRDTGGGPSGSWWQRTTTIRVARRMLRLASGLVPRHARAEWVEEWEGELWALDRRAVGGGALLSFALGGVGDAVRESILGRREGTMGTSNGSGLFHDLQAALRRIRRSPGAAMVTVVVLALGIGANAALFGALRSALIGGAPYPESDRLVVIDLLIAQPDAPADTLPWSYPKYEAVRDDMPFLSASAGYFARTVTISGAGDPVRLPVELVSSAYFTLLGVEPVVGRTLLREEAGLSDERVAVLAHSFWVERFGSDPGVAGRDVTINGERFQIVGVARPGFHGLTGSAVAWVPIEAAPLVMDRQRLERAWSHWFRVVGRLERSVSLDAARAGTNALGDVLTAAYPHPQRADASQAVELTLLDRARVNATSRLAVSVVAIGAVLLLLIAAANVAGLMLARTSSRRGDLAVRAALGAGGSRLARETLVESMLLALGGGAAGIALALAGQGAVRWAVSYALETSGTRNLQFLDPASLSTDAVIPLVGLGIAMVTGLVFGLAPARMAARTNLTGELAVAGRGGPPARGAAGEHTRGVLVVGQLALTVVLLSGAGLMYASFARLDGVALGFQPEGVVTARYELGPEFSPDEIRAFDDALLERLEARPDVSAAAVAVCAPLAGLCDITGVREVDGVTFPEDGEIRWIHTQSVSPSYFEVAGVRILRGSGLPRELRPEDPARVVLNTAAAERYFPGIDPVGRTISVTHQATPEGRPAEVVGIVDDVAYQELEAGGFPAVYFSAEQVPAGWGQILVRSSGEPMALAEAVRETVLSLRSDLPVWDVVTLEARKDAATARTRVILGLFASFGLTALLLSAVGLWGLVAYAVSRRTREMGLRMALGAGRTRILGAVAAGPMILTVAGAIAGLVAASLLGRFLRVLLFDVAPGDARVHLGALAVLVGVATAAVLFPALRAMRVDPSSALRSE
jgi:putative ABC transport system permease protein